MSYFYSPVLFVCLFVSDWSEGVDSFPAAATLKALSAFNDCSWDCMNMLSFLLQQLTRGPDWLMIYITINNKMCDYVIIIIVATLFNLIVIFCEGIFI